MSSISISSSSSSLSGDLPRKQVEPVLTVGSVVKRRYEIVGMLGSGGMGQVYEARDRKQHTRVALKAMHPHLGKLREAEQRFRREARALYRLRSPHIARLIDFGRHESGSLYLVMEHVEGHDLTTELEQRGPLAWQDAHALIDQVCAALEAVHGAGLVHRDLKPRNVMVSGQGECRVAKVVDFGLSKSLVSDGRSSGPITREGVALGSIQYMAPEQAVGRPDIDARADVFSVGCLLYFLLMGQPPFSQRAIARTGRAGGSLSFPSIGYRRQDVPPHVDEVLRVALSPDRDHRFRSVSAMRMALGSAIPTGAIKTLVVPVRRERPGQRALRSALLVLLSAVTTMSIALSAYWLLSR